MSSLVTIRQYIRIIYSRYEVYLKPLFKFILALISILTVNKHLGNMSTIMRFPVVLIVALMCSFMPMNFIVLVSAFFALLHLYSLSLECAAVAGVVFLLMFLLYFRFSPKDTIAVVLTPICFILKIPYVMPLAMGLVGTPTSSISVGCGVIAYYVLHSVKENGEALKELADEETATKLRYIIDSVIGNKGMVVVAIAFAVTIILVYIIRKMNINYAWTIAIAAGALINIMVMLIGNMMFDTGLSMGGLFLGTIVAVLVALVIQFFCFHVDYSKTEKVQFEDDEYYYYVKAVPKVTIATVGSKGRSSAQRAKAPAKKPVSK